MENKKITNQYNYTPEKGEINEEPSMTVPGLTLTVKEILEKYVNGIAPPIAKPPQYSDAEEFEDAIPTLLDLTDLTDNQVKIENLTEQLKSRTKKSNQDETPDKKQPQGEA